MRISTDCRGGHLVHTVQVLIYKHVGLMNKRKFVRWETIASFPTKKEALAWAREQPNA